MAEISDLHRHLQRSRHEEYEQDDEFYLHPNNFDDFDPFCLHNDFAGPFLLDDCTAPFDLNQEPENPESEHEDPNCFEEDGERMDFAVDLFESGERLDPVWETDSESGFGSESRGFELLALGMDSRSDSEEFEVNSGITIDDSVDDSFDGIRVSDSNIFQIGDIEREEFEWEEVSEMIHIEDREALNHPIDQIREEISLMSEGENPVFVEDDDNDEEQQGNIGWEILLAMNDLERNFDIENSDENNHIFVMEHDAVFGHLVATERGLNGSPPAAKCAVENLPIVVLRKEESGEGVVCAVCKDDVGMGEKAIKMPCCHLFHRECIVPWLGIRNTCPVCRYELPTDDAEYERRRVRRGNLDGVEVWF